MCEQVATDERAVLQRAVTVAASVLGDAVAVYLPGPIGLEPVAFDHTDPNRAVVLGAMMRGGVTGEPTFSSRSVTDEPVLVPQVAQRDVRTGIRPEFHQFLSTLGFYSVVSAPVVLRDGRRGAVFAARDTPGRPYTLEDLAFVEEVAQRVALAVKRATQGRGAWAARAELLRVIRECVENGDVDCGDRVLATVADDEAAVVVDPEGRVQAASKAFATLLESTAADVQRADLVRLLADGAEVRAMVERLLGGELDYCSIVVSLPRATRRIELHGAIVRLPDATPACILFVAHERPERPV
jgi:PAS domain-containing protein